MRELGAPIDCCAGLNFDLHDLASCVRAVMPDSAARGSTSCAMRPAAPTPSWPIPLADEHRLLRDGTCCGSSGAVRQLTRYLREPLRLLRNRRNRGERSRAAPAMDTLIWQYRTSLDDNDCGTIVIRLTHRRHLRDRQRATPPFSTARSRARRDDRPRGSVSERLSHIHGISLVLTVSRAAVPSRRRQPSSGRSSCVFRLCGDFDCRLRSAKFDLGRQSAAASGAKPMFTWCCGNVVFAGADSSALKRSHSCRCSALGQLRRRIGDLTACAAAAVW